MFFCVGLSYFLILSFTLLHFYFHNYVLSLTICDEILLFTLNIRLCVESHRSTREGTPSPKDPLYQSPMTPNPHPSCYLYSDSVPSTRLKYPLGCLVSETRGDRTITTSTTQRRKPRHHRNFREENVLSGKKMFIKTFI